MIAIKHRLTPCILYLLDCFVFDILLAHPIKMFEKNLAYCLVDIFGFLSVIKIVGNQVKFGVCKLILSIVKSFV